MDARVQTPRADDPADSSIGDLFHQLVDDGRAFVTAEANLYKQIATYRAGKAKNGIVALVAGGLLAYAALIAFLVGLVIGLADFMGPVLGGLVVLAVSGGVAFLLIRYGVDKMSALGGDAEEKAALKRGEQRA
ncbi:MAG: phage holin family protein [Pseudomonadota bacterium]|nr:phage holin family protein [Pseudomonadota bacterium]